MGVRDQIIAAVARRTAPHTFQGVGVRLRELLRREHQAALAAVAVDPDGVIRGQANVDRWNASLVAAGMVDPETDQPLFTVDELLGFVDRAKVWDAIATAAQAILRLSEVADDPASF